MSSRRVSLEACTGEDVANPQIRSLVGRTSKQGQDNMEMAEGAQKGPVSMGSQGDRGVYK